MLTPVTNPNGFSIERPPIIDRRFATKQAQEILARHGININNLTTRVTNTPNYNITDKTLEEVFKSEDFKDKNLSKK